MQLSHIDIANLAVSATNMRAGKKPPDIADILPSVRARGVLVPLLVRPNGDADTFEIVAGRRRFHAALALAEERGSAEPLPCAVLGDGDDASAIEASLIENIARLDPDEVTQWRTFSRLVKEGRSVEDIAATFGLTELAVTRVLALGNLHPRIRALYAARDIDAATVRQLTMASLPRQKDWLALWNDPDQRAPTGHALKSWLFGGAAISCDVALFDLADYPAPIVADLFGEERYFSDADAFWALQNAAIEAKATAYREAGWAGVEVLQPGQYFQRWEHEKAPKAKGGKVFIAVSPRGEVEVHEGWLTCKEARRLARGNAAEEEASKPARSEMTSVMQAYVDLHRHAAVRAKLAEHPGVALRLAVAHMIAGSPLWNVRPEPQRAPSDLIAESVETCMSETAFDTKRRAVLALLEFDAETSTIVGGNTDGLDAAGVFAKLLTLGDEDVLSVLAIVMGETLAVSSAEVEAVGLHLGIDMAAVWQADAAFLDVIRDREVLVAMLAEVAGPAVAEANKAEKAKTLRTVIRDCLAGENGRAKVENWVPKWMAFPPTAYTPRGGVGAVQRHARIAPLFANAA